MQKDLRTLLFLLMALCLAIPAVAQHDHDGDGPEGPPDPTEIKLSTTVKRLIDDPLTDKRQRRALQLFHGQWEQIDAPLSLADKAQVALWRWDLDAPSLYNPQTPALLRGEGALLRGEAQAAIDLLPDTLTAQVLLLRARAMMDMGLLSEAVVALQPVREMLIGDQLQDAAELTAAARAVVLLAKLEGRPAQDYQLAMNLLSRVHNEIDRLYWPAHLAEAEVLMSKDNTGDAVAAVGDTLHLNPRASEAWYRMGLAAARGFQFEIAERCAAKLDEINKDHVLGDLLLTEMMLSQKDAPGAREALAPALKRYPNNRMIAAMDVATAAMSYDDAAEAAAIARFNALSPGNAAAYALAGRYLSIARQYEHGAQLLAKAIELQPNWAEPRIELGLLLMQSGDEVGALKALRGASQIDRFNTRANNQLELVNALINEYESIETPHFIIRYKPGMDAALARDMPLQIERIYDEVTAIFQHEPQRKTLIEILPDERHFAVRITGIPEIWTIAASTGDVIAMTPPRIGSKQRGTFDWLTVIRHEFVHTVTLDQTRNRIPHWFTEACAVSVEPAGRDYPSSMLLASALHEDQLFNMREINWAFVRPKRPTDRQLAYMQAHWVLEYITQTHGHQAIVDMLTTFRTGASTEEAIEKVCNVKPEPFMEAFKVWAAGEVDRWGLGPQADVDIADKSMAELTAIHNEHPHHPDVLRAMAGQESDPEKARELTLRYTSVRPVDPWAQQQLAALAIKLQRPREAISAMEQLDRMDNSSGKWAVQLAAMYRNAERYDMALDAMRRALNREPYNASYRELAAAIALQGGNNEAALHHVIALTLTEPDRAVNWLRLAAMHQRMEDNAAAREAAQKAKQIDPKVNIERFVNG